MSLMGAWLDRRERRMQTIAPQDISQNPSQPLIAALGGAPSAAGVTVTEQTASAIPVVFACDKVIKQDIAKTPIKLKRKLSDGTRRDDVDHPVYALLHDLPNPAMTAFEFKETMQGWLNLWGNAYAEIIRNARREPIALWPLDSSRMTVKLNGSNQLVYGYRMADGKLKDWTFDPANPPIFHLRQNALDGIHGRSPVQVLRESLGIAMASSRYIAKHFGQGGHPQTVLSTTQKLNAESAKRIRSDFETLTSGERNWHRAVVLDHDLKPVPFVMPHRDAQFLETWKFTRSEITGTFRVPAHKVNDLEKATFSNIEHMAIEHVNDCLMPHFVCWQQAIARDLLNAKSFNTHFAVFVVDALVRGDMKTMNEALQLQRQNGVINANGWRRALDMDDQISEGDGGDLYLVNGNMMPMQRDPAAVVDGLPPATGPVN